MNAAPVKLTISGLDAPGVFPLHTMEDSFRLHQHLTNCNPTSALIIGAGYIGMEMADALTHRGLKVTFVTRPQTVLNDLDLSYTPPFGSPWDAIQMSVQAWSRALAHRQSGQELVHA